MVLHSFRAALLPILLLSSAIPYASAGTLTAIGTRAGVGGNDTISWSALGTELDVLTGGTTVGGNAFTLSGASTLTLLSGGTYNADFLATDTVITTFDAATGPLAGGIRIRFTSPIQAAGAQIQISAFGIPFTAVIEAFGLGGVSFGTVSANGQVSNPSQANGSALFLGVASSLRDIYELEFRTGTDGMAINDVTIDDIDSPVIPEPATGVLMALAAGVMYLARGRRG